MTAFIDMTGQVCGRWTVLKLTTKKGRQTRWLCRCSCGVQKRVAASNLRDGHSRSCGCFNVEVARERRLLHGMTGTRLYRIWYFMWKRCTKPSAHNYRHYGGRGIVICAAWKDPTTFATWALENGYTSKLTLDRKNNDGPYSPKNCRWVRQRIQNRNTRRNIIVMYGGKRMCLTDVAHHAGLSPSTVAMRRKRGWPIDRWLHGASRRVALIDSVV